MSRHSSYGPSMNLCSVRSRAWIHNFLITSTAVQFISRATTECEYTSGSILRTLLFSMTAAAAFFIHSFSPYICMKCKNKAQHFWIAHSGIIFLYFYCFNLWVRKKAHESNNICTRVCTLNAWMYWSENAQYKARRKTYGMIFIQLLLLWLLLLLLLLLLKP